MGGRIRCWLGGCCLDGEDGFARLRAICYADGRTDSLPMCHRHIVRSCRRPAGGRQVSAGDLPFIVRIRTSAHNKKSNTERCWIFCGGGGRIRTIEAKRSRFTVCPLWPLGNSPILICLTWLCMEPVDGLVQSMNGSVKPSPATLARVAFHFSSPVEHSVWLEPVDGLEPPTY